MGDSQLIAKRRADKKAAMQRVQDAENREEEASMNKVSDIAQRSAGKNSKIASSMMIKKNEEVDDD